MKSNIYYITYRLITIISVMACFVPVGIVLFKKLYKEKLYILIFFYWLINGLVNITNLFNLQISNAVEDTITLTANLLDVPIVLWIFYLAADKAKKPSLKITLISFIVFELLITAVKGFNYDSSTIIIGAGLIIIIFFAVLGIMQYLSAVEHTPQENMMVFLYSSFLFFYGSFTIIYFFSYLTKIGNDSENFFLYYIELLLASIPVIYALLRYGGIKAATARQKMQGFE